MMEIHFMMVTITVQKCEAHRKSAIGGSLPTPIHKHMKSELAQRWLPEELNLLAEREAFTYTLPHCPARKTHCMTRNFDLFQADSTLSSSIEVVHTYSAEVAQAF
jgi:hypothetical protein